MKSARNLRDTAEAAYKAAAAKDSAKLSEIADGKLYPICEGCHKEIGRAHV